MEGKKVVDNTSKLERTIRASLRSKTRLTFRTAASSTAKGGRSNSSAVLTCVVPVLSQTDGQDALRRVGQVVVPRRLDMPSELS